MTIDVRDKVFPFLSSSCFSSLAVSIIFPLKSNMVFLRPRIYKYSL